MLIATTTDKCQGVLINAARGVHSSKNVYSDLDIDKLETLTPAQPHRDVDLSLVEATQGVIYSSFNMYWGINDV